jgi:hypothetical protein
MEISTLLATYGSTWNKIHEERDGQLLKEVFSGTALELPYARAHKSGNFESKAFVEALNLAGLDSYVARASFQEELSGARDHRKLLRDLCLQIITLRKNVLIRRLAVELKNSPEDKKTAHILQQIQTLRKEVEDLKKFSFSL